MKIWIKATLVFSLFVIVGGIMTYLISVSSVFSNVGFIGLQVSLLVSILPVSAVFHGFHELSHIAYLRFNNMEDQIDRFSLQSIRTKEDAPLGSFLSPLYSFPVSTVIVWILGFHNPFFLVAIVVAFIFGWMIGDFKKYIEKRDKHSQDRTAKL